MAKLRKLLDMKKEKMEYFMEWSEFGDDGSLENKGIYEMIEKLNAVFFVCQCEFHYLCWQNTN